MAYRRIAVSSGGSRRASMKRHFSTNDLRTSGASSDSDRWCPEEEVTTTIDGDCASFLVLKHRTNGAVDMVSRRKILSRSRDDLMNMNEYPNGNAAGTADDEDDVWYNKDKLYRDHMQEVLEKWTQIDDEIWAKVICFERNRRVAKAYARAPVLTINSSDDGFDGYRIGLLGFDNPMRDSKTEEVKRHIGHGVKIKMDDAGNILVKRVSKANVYVKDVTGQDNDNSLSVEALRLQNGALEVDKPVKLFDMKKFQHNVSRELKRAYPDRRKLEFQCISAVAFVKNEADLLDCPCWVIVINIVAMDMLKSKLPPVQRKHDFGGPRGRVPAMDEDPYSVPGQPGSGVSSSSSSANSREKRLDRPPKLPPRDTGMSRYQIPKPDYEEQQQQLQQQQQQLQANHADENKYRIPHLHPMMTTTTRKTTHTFPDDPYYCGMKAHTPNFAGKGKMTMHGGNGQQPPALNGLLTPPTTTSSSSSSSESPYARTWLMPYMQPNHIHPQHTMRTRASEPSLLRPPEPIYDTRIGAEQLQLHRSSRSSLSSSSKAEDHYSHIYGRVSLPRFVNSFRPRTVYVGEWE